MYNRLTATRSYNLTQGSLNQIIQQYQAQGIPKATIIDELKDCGNDVQQLDARLSQQISIQIFDQQQLQQTNLQFPINQMKVKSSIIIPQDQRMFNIFALQDQLRTDEETPVGLMNLGNSCFLNIIMQCFFNCVSFRNLILQISHPKTPNAASDFLKATQELFAQMQFGNKKYLDPSDFLSRLNEYKPEAALSTYEQNDYNEALVLLLDAFEEAMKETDNKGQAQRFHKMFIGQAQESLVCQQQIRRSSQTEFTSISVEAKGGNLLKAFKASCQLMIEDYLPGQNAEIIQKIQYAPQVFQFHMNRVSYNISLQELQKTNSRCEFTDKINLDEYISQRSVIKTNDLDKLELEKQELMEKLRKCGTESSSDMDNLIQKIMNFPLDEIATKSNLQPQILYQQLVILKEELTKRRNDLNKQLERLNAQIDKIKQEKKITNEYILTGVLIHSGNAQYGHYYCYLMQGDKWWKFNDRQVYEADYIDVYKDAQGEIFLANNVVGLIYCKDMDKPLQIHQLSPYLKGFIEKEKDKFLTEIDREIVMSLKNTIHQRFIRQERPLPRQGISKAFQHLVYSEEQIQDPDLRNAFIKFQICKQEIEGSRRLHCPLKKFDYLKYFFIQSGMFGSYQIDQILNETKPFVELSQKLLSINLEGRIFANNLLLMAEKFEQLCNILQETKDKTASSIAQNLYNAILLKGPFVIDLMHQLGEKSEVIKSFARVFYQYTNQIQTQKPFIYPKCKNQLSDYFSNHPQLFKQISICTNKASSQIYSQVLLTPEAFLNALDSIDKNTKLWQGFLKTIEEQGRILSQEERLSQESPFYFDER